MHSPDPGRAVGHKGEFNMHIKGLALCGAAVLALSGGVAFAANDGQAQSVVAQNTNTPNQPMQPSTTGTGPTTPTMDQNQTTSPAVNPPGSTPGSNPTPSSGPGTDTSGTSG